MKQFLIILSDSVQVRAEAEEKLNAQHVATTESKQVAALRMMKRDP
jgi:hypothetical protein